MSNELGTITRRELAELMRMSPNTVCKSEARTGLKGCRVKWRGRMVIYRRRDALLILKAMGFPV